MTLLHIDPSAAAPIWRQIEVGVRRMVVSGALAKGSPVPSVRDLARELGVNPATVSKAYQKLTTAGVLEVRRGEGTFVTSRPAATVKAERLHLLEAEARRYARAAADLGATGNEAVSAVRRAWKSDGEGSGGGE